MVREMSQVPPLGEGSSHSQALTTLARKEVSRMDM
jgi:hypothetical protein